MTTTTTTTYERITTIGRGDVMERIHAANLRVLAAADDMIDRHHQRGGEPTCPSDMAPLDLPMMPPVPEEIERVLSSICCWSRPDCRAKEMTCIHRRRICSDRDHVMDTATAPQLVAAIRAADEYAAHYEAAARQYRDATAAAVAKHVAEHADACRELVGLVAAAR